MMKYVNRISFQLVAALLMVAALGLGTGTTPVKAAADFELSPELTVFDDLVGSGPSDPGTITITNTGTETIEVTSIQLSGSNYFRFFATPSTPFFMGPNTTTDLQFEFNSEFQDVKIGNVTVTASGITKSVELRGLGREGEGGDKEPSLEWIFEAFGFDSLSAGDDDPDNYRLNERFGGTAPLLGSEVAVQSFQKANGGQPVTVEPLGAFGLNGTPAIRVGWYPTGNTGSKNEVFTVNNGEHQKLFPGISGSTSFDPGSQAFSMYTIWPPFGNREVFQENHFNTWEPDRDERHKARVYPMPGEANAYILAWEEFDGSNSNSEYDFNDIIFVVRNVQPATTGNGGSIDFTNLDWLTLMDLDVPGTDWMNTWLTFASIGAERNNPTTKYAMHLFSTVRIHNTSSTNVLQITSMSTDDPSVFKLVSDQTTFAIPPNGFQDVQVEFVEVNGSKGPRFGTLTIFSNDPQNPVSTINLGGGYQQGGEGANEYLTPVIVSSFGFKTDIGNIPGGQRIAAGEEILSVTWEVLDRNEPVYARQIASFHGCCTQEARFYMNFEGGGDPNFWHDGPWGHSYFPEIRVSGSPATYLGDPAELVSQRSGSNSNFRFFFDIEGDTSCEEYCENDHGVRVWPARDPQGNVMLGTYIVVQDYVGIAGVTNYDYNDNVYLVSNIKPVSNGDPDMEIIGDAPDETFIGGQTTFSFNVVNSKPFAANDVTATISLPGAATYISHSNDACTKNGNQINCDFGDNFTGSQLVEIVLEPTVIGQLTLNASVSTSSNESDTSDNTGSASTNVRSQSAPVANNDNYSVDINTPLSVNAASGVLSNDTDADADPLTAILVSPPANAASFNLNANGSFNYTPPTDFSGVTSFTYKVNDTFEDSNVATVTINVIPDNGPPVVGIDTYTVDEDNNLNVNAANGVLANDNDPEGTPLIALSDTMPSNGNLTLNADGSFTYTPDEHFNGADSFTYIARDGDNLTSVGTVNITVNSVNDMPVANNDNFSIMEDETLTISDPENGVLANDTDVESLTLTAAINDLPNNGVVSLNSDGTFTYTPSVGFNGTDSFTYFAVDGDGGQGIAAVTINIGSSNDIPVVNPDVYNASFNATLSVSAAEGVLANDSDPDGDTLTASKVTDPENGAVTVNTDGSFTYTPNTDFSGQDSFLYRADDGNGAIQISSVTLNVGVSAANDLIINGSFETQRNNNNKLPATWDLRKVNKDKIKCNKIDRPNGKPDKIFASEGDCAFMFKGEPNKNVRLIQKPDFSEVTIGDTLTAYVSVEGKNVVETRARYQVKVKYTDGDKDKFDITFPGGTYPYTVLSDSVVVRKEIKTIKVMVQYRRGGDTGKFFVDGVKLLVTTGAPMPTLPPIDEPPFRLPEPPVDPIDPSDPGVRLVPPPTDVDTNNTD